MPSSAQEHMDFVAQAVQKVVATKLAVCLHVANHRLDRVSAVSTPYSSAASFLTRRTNRCRLWLNRRVSVGQATAFSCTVLSMVTRSRLLALTAPLLKPTLPAPSLAEST